MSGYDGVRHAVVGMELGGCGSGSSRGRVRRGGLKSSLASSFSCMERNVRKREKKVNQSISITYCHGRLDF